MLDIGYVAPPGRGGEVVISSVGAQGLGTPIAGMRLASANLTWPAANAAIFLPVTVPEAVTITKLWWCNNGALASNLDIGIYQEDGTRLVSSGSTAMTTAQTCQVVDITDTTLQRGRYYIGIACDTASTNTYLCFNPAAGICQALGVVRQTSAFPLASNANPATFAVTTHAFIPVCGMQGYRTVGP